MNSTERAMLYKNKFHSYTVEMCEVAIKDCHETLNVGEYAMDDPYAIKLWAEIDAIRDRQMILKKD